MPWTVYFNMSNAFNGKNACGIEINPLVLQNIMKARGHTAQTLADAVGVTKQTIYNWMWGDASPYKENLEKLCKVLDIPERMMVASSRDLVEKGQHLRIVRFHTNEILGLNDDPTYAETRDILQDLNAEADRDAGEEEVRQEDLTVFGEDESHSDPESDPETGDEESSSGDNG